MRPGNSQMGGRTIICACAWNCTEHLGSELLTVEWVQPVPFWSGSPDPASLQTADTTGMEMASQQQNMRAGRAALNQARVPRYEQIPLTSICHLNPPLLKSLLPSLWLQPLATKAVRVRAMISRPLQPVLMVQVGAEIEACVNKALVKSQGPSFLTTTLVLCPSVY